MSDLLSLIEELKRDGWCGCASSELLLAAMQESEPSVRLSVASLARRERKKARREAHG